MDVLKFLQGGNQTPNPKYNPKTKKGAIQPPTLVDYNPGTSISDRGRGHLFSRIAGFFHINFIFRFAFADQNFYFFSF